MTEPQESTQYPGWAWDGTSWVNIATGLRSSPSDSRGGLLHMGWRKRLVTGLLAWPLLFAMFVYALVIAEPQPDAFAKAALIATWIGMLVAVLVGLTFPVWALVSWASEGDRASRQA